MVFTCTKAGGQESSQTHNLEFGSPDIRGDLGKIVVLWEKKGGKKISQSTFMFSIDQLRKNANT